MNMIRRRNRPKEYSFSISLQPSGDGRMIVTPGPGASLSEDGMGVDLNMTHAAEVDRKYEQWLSSHFGLTRPTGSWRCRIPAITDYQGLLDNASGSHRMPYSASGCLEFLTLLKRRIKFNYVCIMLNPLEKPGSAPGAGLAVIILDSTPSPLSLATLLDAEAVTQFRTLVARRGGKLREYHGLTVLKFS